MVFVFQQIFGRNFADTILIRSKALLNPFENQGHFALILEYYEACELRNSNLKNLSKCPVAGLSTACGVFGIWQYYTLLETWKPAYQATTNEVQRGPGVNFM